MSPRSRLALATLAAALILAPVAALHPAASHLSSAGLARVSIEITHPVALAFLALALVSVLPTAGFLIAMGRAVRGFRHLRALRRESEPASLNGICYRLVQSETVSIFTTGLVRPVTFVTAGAEAALGPSRLLAALLHEEAHQRHHDLRWRLLLQAVGRGFSYIPGIKDVVEAEALRTECHADEYAVRGGAGRLDLFEAIVTASTASAHPATVGLTDANVAFRLMRLVDPALPLPARPTRTFVALTALVAAPALAVHVAGTAIAAVGGSHLMI
jgi:hypothetical protein